MTRPVHTVNFFTRTLMVLLRMAIGWHLCFEGLTKLDAHWADLAATPTAARKEFSAEGYLRNANGPLREHFRKMVPDRDGLDKLNPAYIEQLFKDRIAAISARYQLDATQQQQVDKLTKESITTADKYLADEATVAKLKEYRDNLAKRSEWESPTADPLERQSRTKRLAELDASRRELTDKVDGLLKDIESQILLMLTPDQRAMREPMPKIEKMNDLEKAEFFTKWGLAIFGACMLIGLFSRLSSLGAACLLAMFYLSNIPWPGYPAPPNAEGTYLIVNKNLIELIACLMLATSPSGAWGGLDSLIRGLITRPLFGFGKQEVIGA